MQVSFNKIVYIMLVYFVSCYLSLAMSLRFFKICMYIVYSVPRILVLLVYTFMENIQSDNIHRSKASVDFI